MTETWKPAMKDDYWRSLTRAQWKQHVRKSEISPPGPVALAFMAQREKDVRQERRLGDEASG